LIRDGASFKGLFEAHANPGVIAEVSMDMSPAFIKAAREYLPWCIITFDKWHGFKLFERQLDQVDPQVRALAFAHRHQFYEAIDQEHVGAHLAFLADYLEDCLGKNSRSRSIRGHVEGLVNYVRSRLSNVVLEGINNKIQMIKRVARGFRKTEHFMKMILFVFGSWGTGSQMTSRTPDISIWIFRISLTFNLITSRRFSFPTRACACFILVRDCSHTDKRGLSLFLSSVEKEKTFGMTCAESRISLGYSPSLITESSSCRGSPIFPGLLKV
jgi:hypothetical protein